MTHTGDDSPRSIGAHWASSAIVYLLFSAAVFVVQGSQPPLGSDHLSYLELADSIIDACPTGEYWRETNSIRFYGVLLAYLHAWTGSHILSMKLVLAAFSVLFLLAAELFFSLFAASRRQAVLFALLSGFAVSFGFASWGLTDSTALLPRTLVAPLVMLAMWLWFRFDDRPLKYLALWLLVVASVVHLSTFYVVAVLCLVEAWDFAVLRRMRIDRRVAAFLGALSLAFASLLALEYAGIANKSISQYIPDKLRSIGLNVPNIRSVEARTLKLCRDVSPPARPRPGAQARPQPPGPPPKAAAPAAPGPRPLSARQAWEVELSMRPWRNMPLPMTNVANAFSSSALILLLAVAGMIAARRSGYSRTDRLMTAMFFAVPAFAFLPQTALWILRSFTSVYPATIEEVRALSLIMVPALYFILRLFRRIVESGARSAPLKGGAVIVAVLALPLFMKNLPQWVREGLLSTMVALNVVDGRSEGSVANAKAALGILPGSSALYYSTEGVRKWLDGNTASGARILTDRDDLILLRDKVILGPRQVAVNVYKATPSEGDLFLRTSRAMSARDLAQLRQIGSSYDADFIVVGWRVEGASYADEAFSVIPLREGLIRAQP